MSAAFPDVDHLFRHEYGKIVALLTSKFTPEKIDLIEDAVQEALYKAMKTWPYGETPANPSGWLYRVARNHLLDRLRRANRSVCYDEAHTAEPVQAPAIVADDALTDEQLKMLFACCHPTLSQQDQLLLSLKLMGGLSTGEIAKALFKQPEAIKKAFTRAKQKFREKVGHLEVPVGEGLKPRLDNVLKVIYLMFNEGYKSAEGEALIKKDICEEAIRHGLLLRQHPACNSPDLNALLALMCLHAARFDSRIDGEGRLVTLEHQDRSRWDRDYIAYGLRYLNEAAYGIVTSHYHLMAAIAAYHVEAPSFAETDWAGILMCYDMLLRIDPSPVVQLNRAVAVGKVQGPQAALMALDDIAENPSIRDNHMYYAIRGDLEREAGDGTEAKRLYERSVELADNAIERAFLRGKAESL